MTLPAELITNDNAKYAMDLLIEMVRPVAVDIVAPPASLAVRMLVTYFNNGLADVFNATVQEVFNGVKGQFVTNQSIDIQLTAG